MCISADFINFFVFGVENKLVQVSHPGEKILVELNTNQCYGLLLRLRSSYNFGTIAYLLGLAIQTLIKIIHFFR